MQRFLCNGLVQWDVMLRPVQLPVYYVKMSLSNTLMPKIAPKVLGCMNAMKVYSPKSLNMSVKV